MEKKKIIFGEEPIWLYNTNTEWCQYCFRVIINDEKISFCPDVIEPCTSDVIKEAFSSLDELINFVKRYLEDHSLKPDEDFNEFLQLLREHNLIK